MAVKGFYAIHNSEIRFGKDGQWYADGERIANDKIADLFSRSIEKTEAGSYQLRVGDEVAPILVDDTAYVVTGVETSEAPMIRLNDGSVEELVGDSLEISDENVFYCRVKGGTERARFLRPAHYQLGERLEEDSAGQFALRLGHRAIPIRRA